MKRILAVVLIALGIGLGVVGLQQPSIAVADSKADVCAGVGAVSGGTGCNSQGPTVNGIATTIVNFMSALVGLLSVVMIIWGGFRYVTSGGDSGKITSARTTIVYALVGLVIVALAQTIVKFVITKTVG